MDALRRGEAAARLGPRGGAGEATTLAVVATDAMLTKAEATKVAQMAHDGLARSINPVHTMSDGDVVFALATGASGRTAAPTLIGALAADVLAEAVVRAVRAARAIGGAGLPDLPCAADFTGGGTDPLAIPTMNPSPTRRRVLQIGRRRGGRAPAPPAPSDRAPTTCHRSSSCRATATPPRSG